MRLTLLTSILLLATFRIGNSQSRTQNRLNPAFYETCDNAKKEARRDLVKARIDTSSFAKIYTFSHLIYDFEHDSIFTSILKDEYGLERVNKSGSWRDSTLKCYNSFIRDSLTLIYGRDPILSASEKAKLLEGKN